MQYFLILVVVILEQQLDFLYALRHFYNVIRVGCANNCSISTDASFNASRCLNRCCITKIGTKGLSSQRSLFLMYSGDLPILSKRKHAQTLKLWAE
jgi:hypothetical protein